MDDKNKLNMEQVVFRMFHSANRGGKVYQVSPRECMGVSLLLPGECLGGDHKIEDLLESICWKA